MPFVGTDPKLSAILFVFYNSASSLDELGDPVGDATGLPVGGIGV